MLNFSTLKEFTDHPELSAASFPLRAMGSKHPVTATMLAEVYAAPDDPTVAPPAVAPFGTINRAGVRLDETITYSKVVAPAYAAAVAQTYLHIESIHCAGFPAPPITPLEGVLIASFGLPTAAKGARAARV